MGNRRPGMEDRNSILISRLRRRIERPSVSQMIMIRNEYRIVHRRECQRTRQTSEGKARLGCLNWTKLSRRDLEIRMVETISITIQSSYQVTMDTYNPSSIEPIQRFHAHLSIHITTLRLNLMAISYRTTRMPKREIKKRPKTSGSARARTSKCLPNLKATNQRCLLWRT